MKNVNTTQSAMVRENTPEQHASRFDLKYFLQTDALENALQEMLPEKDHEEKIMQRAKAILGKEYTDEDAKALIASFEYLISSWMEEYEKNIFHGKRLRELVADV